MIKFEEHDNQLFLMLEKPVPLTPDAEMPCLVRLIQDDSPMGKYNQDMCKLPLRTIEMCIGINRQYQSAISKSSSHYARYEVIGCHVAEGSKEWALYQMMQGEKVRHESYVLPKTHCAMNEKHQIAIFTKPSSMIDGGDFICHANDWFTYSPVDAMIDYKNGWQLYKEQFKVGDWVEVQGKQCEITNSNVAGETPITGIGIDIYGTTHIFKIEDITRKLEFNEVVVYFPGIRPGTVEAISDQCFALKSEYGVAVIMFNMLYPRQLHLIKKLLGMKH